MPQLLKRYAKNVDWQLDLAFKIATPEEMKALGQKPDGYIAGWASTPDLDWYHHIVAPGAFQKSIAERGLTGPRSVKMLIGHDSNKVAGRITVLEYRGTGLWIEAELNLKVSYVQDAYEVMKMTGGWNFSVGFNLKEYKFDETDTGVEYLHILEGDLFEVSAVPFPANEACTMEFIKSRLLSEEPTRFDKASDFEKHLVEELGIQSRTDAHRITLAVKANLHLFGKAKEPEPAPEPTPEPEPLVPAVDIAPFELALANMRKALTAP